MKGEGRGREREGKGGKKEGEGNGEGGGMKEDRFSSRKTSEKERTPPYFFIRGVLGGRGSEKNEKGGRGKAHLMKGGAKQGKNGRGCL